MEGTDPEVANWSEKLEDLVESGDIDSAIYFLESKVQKLEQLCTKVEKLQLALILYELAKLYDSKGFSFRADETRSRALAMKNHALNPVPLNQASLECARKVSVSAEGESFGSCCSAKDVLANDGDLDTVTKSSVGVGHSDEAFSDDDWETKADAEPEELLPTRLLPEISKCSLQDVVEVPKRRGRGTFSYNTEALYSDQLVESTNYDSEDQMFDDGAKQDLTVKNLSYGTRHVLVLDGFKPSYNTMNLENIFKDFKEKFAIRWVNDTVALAVFQSPSTALEAYNSVKCGFTLRLLGEDDILLGSITGRDLEPPKQRPQTSARTAQRLIAHGMGIKLPVTAGFSASKRQEEARRNHLISRQKLKDDAWGPDD